jgi:hypothetical protein
LPDAKGGGPIHFKSISLNRYEQGLLARAVPGAMLLTPPQVDGLLRDVVTKHLNKVERLSAAAKSFPNFNASHAERDDRRAASATWQCSASMTLCRPGKVGRARGTITN